MTYRQDHFQPLEKLISLTARPFCLKRMGWVCHVLGELRNQNKAHEEQLQHIRQHQGPEYEENDIRSSDFKLPVWDGRVSVCTVNLRMGKVPTMMSSTYQQGIRDEASNNETSFPVIITMNEKIKDSLDLDKDDIKAQMQHCENACLNRPDLRNFRNVLAEFSKRRSPLQIDRIVCFGITTMRASNTETPQLDEVAYANMLLLAAMVKELVINDGKRIPELIVHVPQHITCFSDFALRNRALAVMGFRQCFWSRLDSPYVFDRISDKTLIVSVHPIMNIRQILSDQIGDDIIPAAILCRQVDMQSQDYEDKHGDDVHDHRFWRHDPLTPHVQAVFQEYYPHQYQLGDDEERLCLHVRGDWSERSVNRDGKPSQAPID